MYNDKDCSPRVNKKKTFSANTKFVWNNNFIYHCMFNQKYTNVNKKINKIVWKKFISLFNGHGLKKTHQEC